MCIDWSNHHVNIALRNGVPGESDHGSHECEEHDQAEEVRATSVLVDTVRVGLLLEVDAIHVILVFSQLLLVFGLLWSLFLCWQVLIVLFHILYLKF